MDTSLAEELWNETTDAVLAVAPDDTVLFWNRAAESVFGYHSAEAIGRKLDDLIIPDCRRADEKSILTEALTQSVPVYEAERRRKDGSLILASVSCKAIMDAVGRLRFVMSTQRDVTHLKVRRDARSAEGKIRALFDSTSDAMVIIGRDGKISLVNVQAEHLFGYTQPELVGQPIEALMPERFRNKHPAHHSYFFEHPRPRLMGDGRQILARRKDGSEFPVEISLSPVETEAGMFVAGSIRDATQRRHIEYALHEANRAKSEFLANMSHELRTPLNGIIGFSEFLIEGKPGPLNDKQKEYLGDVLSSGRHLLQLINDVLDISKLESGKMTVHPETFVTELVIDEVCSVLFQQVQKKNITIRREVAPDARSVTLDRRKFMQVLYNLLSNGVKINDEGGEIRILVDLEGADSLRVRVCDFGIGIDPGDYPKLFVEFQQLNSGAARRTDGTGLGLALSKKIVEFQGGRIGVQSELGIGSTFTFTLPLPQRVAADRIAGGIVA